MCLYYLLHCIASQNIIITTILILLLHISEKLCYYYYYYYFTYILHDYYLISHIYLIDSQLVSWPLIGLLLYGTMLLYILTTSIILNIKLTYQLCTLLALRSGCCMPDCCCCYIFSLRCFFHSIQTNFRKHVQFAACCYCHDVLAPTAQCGKP